MRTKRKGRSYISKSMDTSEYVGRLERYVDKKLNCKIIDNAVKVYADNEVCYNFDRSHMEVNMYERNIKTEIGSWNTEKISNANFAMLMRTVFKDGKNDMLPHKIDNCNSLDKLKSVIEKYIDEKYYSIGSDQIGKLSIILDDDYKILYRTGNRRYIIDKSPDKKYIFSRFYYEIIYFSSFMNNLKDYETIFNETFSEEEIANLIGY